MKLRKLVNLSRLSDQDGEREITDVCCDSRKASSGCLFFALKGVADDGMKYIQHAIDQGAQCVITHTSAEFDAQGDVLLIKVDHPRDILRQAAGLFYQHPSQHIRTIGITGTNGKTTTTFLLEAILHEAELSCSVIGTVNYRIGENILPSVNTTPGYLDNQKLFARIRDQGVEYCIMEVSSHALDQNRVDDIDFNVGVFTNLSSDHLDYHQTRQKYFEAKAKLFQQLSPQATAVINADDDYAGKLFSKTDAEILTYGIYKNADVRAEDVEMDITGIKFKLCALNESVIVRSSLVGEFNVYNILAAVSAAIAEGISLDKIKRGLERMEQVPGRLEQVPIQEKYRVFIDYAHTQDALQHVLNAIRQTSDARIILVFGCGGDRDRSKRADMGYVASQYADYVFITSDNPRSEEPLMIMKDIQQGFEGNHYQMMVDREQAIQQALSIAQDGDIVLIAGKGHEHYQIFKDRTIKFDEQKIIRQFVRC